ncbi:MAG: carbohydrate ABC transporter permease, partial [Pseudomonadota bacterium]
MAQESVAAQDDFDRRRRLRWFLMRVVVYGLLTTWSIICIFPIYWTMTTSFKLAPDVMQGNMIPWLEFTPQWRG